MPDYHIPVLLKESLEYLHLQSGDIVIDCTLGGGGHSEKIVEKIKPGGKLIAIDQDAEALQYAQKRLAKFNKNILFIHDNYVNLKTILADNHINQVNAVLLDLGVSSHQLDSLERGFSYQTGENVASAPLDMRMDQSQPLTAYEIINRYSEKQLADIFFHYGEEPFSRRIAHRIILSRQSKPISTTQELLDIIKTATPPKYRFSRQHGHWASKIFRALRMEVNDELNVLSQTIPQAFTALKTHGRLVIISFHSLEDRLVKQSFQQYVRDDQALLLTKKPIIPSSEEISANPRAESAKLRAIEKI